MELHAKLTRGRVDIAKEFLHNLENVVANYIHLRLHYELQKRIERWNQLLVNDPQKLSVHIPASELLAFENDPRTLGPAKPPLARIIIEDLPSILLPDNGRILLQHAIQSGEIRGVQNFMRSLSYPQAIVKLDAVNLGKSEIYVIENENQEIQHIEIEATQHLELLHKILSMIKTRSALRLAGGMKTSSKVVSKITRQPLKPALNGVGWVATLTTDFLATHTKQYHLITYEIELTPVVPEIVYDIRNIHVVNLLGKL